MKRLLTTLFCAVFVLQLAVSTAHANELKVLSWNVWYGFTKDVPGRDLSERRKDVRDFVVRQAPDVVALQELNGYTPEALQQDAASWGHEHSVLLKQDGFPTGITSNRPITGIVRQREGFHHGLLRADTHGRTFYVIHLHPSNWQTRHEEIDAIIEDLQQLSAKERKQAVLLGDFNTFSQRDSGYYAGSGLETFFTNRDRTLGERNLKDGRLDYGVIDKLESAGFVDLVVHFRKPDHRPFGTFPTQLRAHENHGAERRLDYVFVNEHDLDVWISARVIDTPVTQLLSDHLPVTATSSTAVADE